MNNSQIALIAKFVKIHIASCRTRTGVKCRQGVSSMTEEFLIPYRSKLPMMPV